MAKDFYAFRVNPESDADIIIMMENVDNKTAFVKNCIRLAVKVVCDKYQNGDEVGDYDEQIRIMMEE